MLEQIRIVMVNTTHSGNIGAAARAMKNMGLTQLALVNPLASLDEEAYARSSGALEVLDNAQHFSSLEAAIADCHLVVGTSARSRHLPWPLLTARQCASKVKEALPSGNKIAIVFGRESRGLTNEELHLCHAHVHIPCNPDFSSLNLSQAIQVLCYEMRLAVVTEEQPEQVETWGVPWDHPLAGQAELEGFYQHLEQTLIRVNFLQPEAPRQLMARLRRLFQRSAIDQTEINILRGMLTAIQKSSHTQGE